MKELKWPAQSLDLNLTEQLWDELEYQQRTYPFYPAFVPDLTNALVLLEVFLKLSGAGASGADLLKAFVLAMHCRKN